MSQQLNGQWFHDRLRDSNKSLRSLAKHMEIDPSAVSRMFSGHRAMKMEEANKIAWFLGVPVSQVLANAGIELSKAANQEVVLSLSINERGELIEMEEPKPLHQSFFDKANLSVGMVSAPLRAAQVRASSGPLSVWDDAVFLFGETNSVEPSAIGLLSICQTRDGRLHLAKIDRARKTGEAVIVSPSGKIEEAELITATPVLAIIP